MLQHHVSAPSGHFGHGAGYPPQQAYHAQQGQYSMALNQHGVHHGLGHHQGYKPQQPNHGSLQLAPNRPAQAQQQQQQLQQQQQHQQQSLLTPKVGSVDAAATSPGNRGSAPQLSTNGAQALEQKVAELEALVHRKDQEIKDLHAMLANVGLKPPSPADKKVRQRDRVTTGGFRKVAESEPMQPYDAVVQDDPVDMRLEEFYNSTGSAISFRRINRGFYRFGETVVELNIINHKLMARTEDGWNRGKFGPVEKFLMYYENIEREKAGIAPEP